MSVIKQKKIFYVIVIMFISVFLSTISVIYVNATQNNRPIEILTSMESQAIIPPSKTLTVDDILYADTPYGPYLSPDASSVMWIKGFYTPGEELPSWEIYISDLSTLEFKKIFSSSDVLADFPQWSPDGSLFSFIAFSSDDNSNQLFILPACGGDVKKVTSVEGGILAHAWQDTDTLVFTAPVVDTEIQDTDSTIHITLETDDKIRLYRVEVTGENVIELSKNDDQIISFWLSPDGTKAFTIHTTASDGGDFYYQTIQNVNYIIDLSDGTQQQVLKDVQSVSGAGWSPDSRSLWVQYDESIDGKSLASRCLLKLIEIDSGNEREIDLDWSRGIHSQTGMAEAMIPLNHGFMVMLADGCSPKIASYHDSDCDCIFTREILEGEHQGNIFSMDVSKDGKEICYLYSTPSKPPQMYVANITSGTMVHPRQFTNINPGWSDKEFVRSEIITWKGAQDDPVEGILYYPNGYEPGHKYPLILMIHGGPNHVDLAEWPGSIYFAYPYQLMAQKGAFVLAPNYHGSTEYGVEFANSIRNGKFYSLPVEDMEKAIEYLAELGMVDDNLLGTLGWSNGSVLSHALIVHDQRFKAASCGAGGNEWLSLWGASLEGQTFIDYYFGANPIENPGMYQDLSPCFQARKVKTPVVMYQGDADVSVPPCMTWIAYRGLQQFSNAPVELFIFPGEGHSIVMNSHRKRKLTEDIQWFDRYLFGQ